MTKRRIKKINISLFWFYIEVYDSNDMHYVGLIQLLISHDLFVLEFVSVKVDESKNSECVSAKLSRRTNNVESD